MKCRCLWYTVLIFLGIFSVFFLGRTSALRGTINTQSFEEKLVGEGTEEERVFCDTLIKIGFNIASQQRELQIRGCWWDFGVMASELGNIHDLAVLQLYSCALSEADTRYLSSQQKLNYLEMESCSFSSHDAIRELQLPNVKKAIFRGVESTPQFAAVLRSMKSVEELHLRHVTSMEPLIGALSELPNLKSLYLYENQLTPQDVLKISQFKKLSEVQIDEKSLTPEDFQTYRRIGISLRAFKKDDE